MREELTFEQILQKHMGLAGELHSELLHEAMAGRDGWEKEIDHYFTKEGMDAWDRLVSLLDDLEDAGILGEGQGTDAIHRLTELCWE